MKHIFGAQLLAVLPFMAGSGSLFPRSQCAEAAALSQRNPAPTDVDVVVVGGGYSGLMSAYDLQQAGLTTVLLEAKDVLGGKTRSQKLKSGPGIIELGATWINNKTQPTVFELTERFGLKTLEQYTEGDSILQGVDGVTYRVATDGSEEPTEDVDEATLLEAKLIGLIIEAAEKVDIRAFDSFPELEDVSVANWVAMKGLWKHENIRGMTSWLTTALVGREPDEIGAHYFFDYIKSGNGLLSLLSEGQDGAQSLMIEEGITSIATHLAEAMTAGSVLLNHPVTKIEQQNDTSIVTAGANNQTFRAKNVVLAITPHMYADIQFSPPLPCEKNVLVARGQPGVYAKMILTYSEPWWRHAGLVGRFTSLTGPIRFSLEISNPALSQYSLAIFITGDSATCWSALSHEGKENAIVEHLATMVGEEIADQARDTLEINYVEWTTEEYIMGAPTVALGPGVLSKYGGIMREPFGSIHFASTELAYEWKGYLEGAITSGKRAAEEIIEVRGKQ